MKFCLECHQTPEYLEKADQIRVDFKDRKIIPDLAEKYPEKDIILVQHYGEELDHHDLETWRILTRDHLVLCLSSLTYVPEAKKHEIPWYWGFPVSSYFQLHALKDMGACYVRLDAPLFFDLPTVEKIGIPVRIVPNVAYMDGLDRLDGVVGTWVRPEDMDAYADYVAAVEFENCDPKKEAAMYRIYAEDKNWPTDLGLLITNLNHTGTNRMIRSDASQRRIDCGQRCLEGNGCRLCYRMLDLANPDMIRNYVNS